MTDSRHDDPSPPPSGPVDPPAEPADGADGDPLDRGLAAAFGEGEPPVSRPGTIIQRRADTSAGPASILDHVATRTGRVSRLHLPDEDSVHGVPSPVLPTTAADETAMPSGKGNYQLMGEIARGGMGQVLKSRDTDLGRDVAMKVLLEQHTDSPSILQRFVEEAQIGGQLQHPGIVPVYELGLLDDDRPYFTMKLVKGRTLAALLAERGDLADDQSRLLSIFEQVCQTLAYAHARRVIHRDLKPANIMVGAFGEVQVVDWGLAKVLQEGGVADEQRARASEISLVETVRSAGTTTAGSQSLVGSVMGTPAYMSPEQAQGEVARLDERTDVFALGAILAEILTGQPAYTGEDDPIVTEAAHGKQERLHQRLGACGAAPELVDIARRCLAPGKELRPRNARALADEVADFRASRDERAREAALEAAASRAKALQERKGKRLSLALAATVVLASLGGTWGYLYMEREASEREAEQQRSADARQAEIGRKVIGVLQDAQLRRGQGDFAAALVALDQAGTVLAATSEAPEHLARRVDDLRSQVIAAREDQEAERREARRLDDFLAALDAVQYGRGDDAPGEVDVRRDAGFQAAFEAFGVDVLAGDSLEVAAALRATGHSQVVAAALDEWARLRLGLEGFGTPAFARLIDIAMDVDRDPWRLKLRRALLTDDRDTLKSLARAPEVRDWPPETVAVYCEAVWTLGHGIDLVDMLTACHLRYPEDFLVASLLGDEHTRRGDHEEALSAYRIAYSLRPHFDRAYIGVASSLLLLERWDETTAFLLSVRDQHPEDDWIESVLFQKASEMMVLRGHADQAIAFHEATLPTSRTKAELNNLAWYLAMEESVADPDRGVAYARRLVEVEPGANSHNTLGIALFRAGEYAEAVEALRTSIEMSEGGNVFDWLVVAMSLKQLGLDGEALQWFERAERAPVDPNYSRSLRNPFRIASDGFDDELRRFMEEARAMFGGQAAPDSP